MTTAVRGKAKSRITMVERALTRYTGHSWQCCYWFELCTPNLLAAWVF